MTSSTVAGAGTGGQVGTAGTGTTTAPTTCTIASTPYVKDYVNDSNNCESCQPSIDPSNWSARPEGTPCGTKKQCVARSCLPTCTIGAETYTHGRANPDNPCQSCDTARSDVAWSNVPTSRCVTDITLAQQHSCAIIGGKGFCWGGNGQAGKLGLGSSLVRSLVATPIVGLPALTSIEAGDFETCALAGNDLYCWGRVTDEDIDGFAEYHPTPTIVSGLPAGAKTSFASDRNATCATVSGDVYCWGANENFVLGLDPASLASSMTPVRVPGVSGASKVAVAGTHACALVGSGAFCWGSNGYGQLGSGSATSPSGPVMLQSVGTAMAIATGGFGEEHTCALVDGLLYCVGAGAYGELGDGEGKNAPTLVQVTGPTSFTRIVAGGYSTCAISGGGDAYCWGANHVGQLGNGTKVNALSPVKVLGLPAGAVTAISVGELHGCAVASGNAYCWGNGDSGQLGNNSQAGSLTAVKVQVP